MKAKTAKGIKPWNKASISDTVIFMPLSFVHNPQLI